MAVMNQGRVIASRDAIYSFWTQTFNISASKWTQGGRKVVSQKEARQNWLPN